MKSDKKEKKKDKKKKNKVKKLTVKDAKQIKESRQANDLDQQITLSLNDQQEQVQSQMPMQVAVQPNVQYQNQKLPQYLEKKRISRLQTSSQVKNNFDMNELLYYFFEHLKFIILITIFFGILGICYCKFFTSPMYGSTAKLYVLTENSANSSLYSDLEAGSSLSVDYKEVFNNWEVTDNVKKKLNIDYSDSTLQSMISISIPSDTRIIAITAKSSSPQFSADLANAYADAAKEFIEQNMSTAEPSIFSTAKSSDKIISHGIKYYGFFSAIGGFILSIMFFSFRYLFDNRPKEPNDLAEATGVPTLAVIPEENRKKGRRS